MDGALLLGAPLALHVRHIAKLCAFSSRMCIKMKMISRVWNKNKRNQHYITGLPWARTAEFMSRKEESNGLMCDGYSFLPLVSLQVDILSPQTE